MSRKGGKRKDKIIGRIRSQTGDKCSGRIHRHEKISWDNFNEGQGLIESVERYRTKYGYYPEAVLADKLYRNRKKLEYCKEHVIRLSRHRLGRPPKDERAQKT